MAVAIQEDYIIAVKQSFEMYLLIMGETINLFEKLGLIIHPDKSKLIPVKIAEYLGFITD